MANKDSDLTALIVDDDENFRESIVPFVRKDGFEAVTASSLETARQAMSEHDPALVLIDLKLPDGSGLDLLSDEERPDAEFVVVTGNATVDSAVTALRDGAFDYLTKPVERARLTSILSNVRRTRELKSQVHSLQDELRRLGRFGSMVGRSPAIQEVYDLLARVAPTDASVFIIGESGTGKELVARTLHALSARRSGGFFALNCGAVSPQLIESEMFGHEKGSFTGAERERAGYFEQASGGTLFLDEITEMPIDLQVKLLRVLETRKVVRVGSVKERDVNVRVVAATNRTPKEAIKEAKLREDLYYRLNVFPITVPPLRGRIEDIELLAQHFLEELNAEYETRKRWDQKAVARLENCAWQGNVRELKNAVHRAFILADEIIEPDHIDVTAAGGGTVSDGAITASDDGSPRISIHLGTPIAEAEKRLILSSLAFFNGDKKQTAEALGISLKTLYNRLNVYDAQNGD